MIRKEYSNRQIEIMNAAMQRIHQFGIQELTIKNLSADLAFSEAALYRHFKSKHEILFELLSYFKLEMESRLNTDNLHTETAFEQMQHLFHSQLTALSAKPAIVCILFSEGIFQFNLQLNEKVSEMMAFMHNRIFSILEKGREKGELSNKIESETLAVIILGSLRLTILNWKLAGNRSNLVLDGENILSDLFQLIQK